MVESIGNCGELEVEVQTREKNCHIVPWRWNRLASTVSEPLGAKEKGAFQLPSFSFLSVFDLTRSILNQSSPILQCISLLLLAISTCGV